tara:strand:+ start:11902 stop:12846 length:945 start_codon:yes stop_codon:yes gene_type:complete
MAQTYGLELELVGISHSQIAAAIQTVDEAIFAGSFGYHGSRRLGLRHARMDGSADDCRWVTETDSSLSCSRTGLTAEIVSPILHGQAGLAHARRIMKAVVRAGAKVNSSCGTHVTMGVDNCSARFRRMGAAAKAKVAGKIIEATDYFWPAFCELVAPSRRTGGRASGYCKRPLGTYDSRINRFGIAAKSYYQDKLRSMTSGKYSAVNISSFRSAGIIEFRMHNGTLNGQKISNYAMLMHRLISWACNADDVDFRNFSPDFDGLCRMINVNAQLRTALEARIAETPDYILGSRDEVMWEHYTNFQQVQRELREVA